MCCEQHRVGDLVTIGDDELLGFARAVSVDGDAFAGTIVLEVLFGAAADQAAGTLELLVDEWCDEIDD